MTMLSIFDDRLTSSGTTATGAPVSQPVSVDFMAVDSAQIAALPVSESRLGAESLRPLSAIAAIAEDLGPADLSTSFRDRTKH